MGYWYLPPVTPESPSGYIWIWIADNPYRDQ